MAAQKPSARVGEGLATQCPRRGIPPDDKDRGAKAAQGGHIKHGTGTNACAVPSAGQHDSGFDLSIIRALLRIEHMLLATRRGAWIVRIEYAGQCVAGVTK